MLVSLMDIDCRRNFLVFESTMALWRVDLCTRLNSFSKHLYPISPVIFVPLMRPWGLPDHLMSHSKWRPFFHGLSIYVMGALLPGKWWTVKPVSNTAYQLSLSSVRGLYWPCQPTTSFLSRACWCEGCMSLTVWPPHHSSTDSLS